MRSAVRFPSLAAVLAALSVHAAAQQPTQPPDTSRAGEPSAPIRETTGCEVTRIVDGDSIECRDLGRVRLIGIDTPELSQEPFGAMARAALATLLDSTAVVSLEPDVERRDQYGRLLAYLWANGVLVNWMMLRHGWAVLLTFPPNVQYVDALTAAQHLARDEGVGLWAVGGFDCLPSDRRRGRC